MNLMWHSLQIFDRGHALKDNFGHKIIILRGVTTGFCSDEERLSAANRQYSVEFGFFETRPTYSEEWSLLSKNGYWTVRFDYFWATIPMRQSVSWVFTGGLRITLIIHLSDFPSFLFISPTGDFFNLCVWPSSILLIPRIACTIIGLAVANIAFNFKNSKKIIIEFGNMRCVWTGKKDLTVWKKSNMRKWLNLKK